MRKQQIITTSGPIMVLSSLLEKMSNGLEYPADCYLDKPGGDGIYLHNPVALIKLENIIEKEKRALKRKKALVGIAAITAQVDGMVFDAGEQSQSRISIRISSMPTKTTLARWKLADNTWSEVTKAQFLKVLAIAADKSTAIMEAQD
jgi:hypothetical protein